MSQSDVVRIAKAHRGVHTWTYSQSGFGTMKRILKDSNTRFGICAALSAYWIHEHSLNGSLANLLTDASGNIKEPMLRTVMNLQAVAGTGLTAIGMRPTPNRFGSVDPHTRNQQQDIGDWLKMKGFEPVMRSFRRQIGLDKKTNQKKYAVDTDEVSWKHASTETISQIGEQMAAVLPQITGAYARISFGGKYLKIKDAGHATATYIGEPSFGSQGDALFFDPNYGEFWFADKEDFFRFFPVFFRSEYLGFPSYFRNRWAVTPCVKAAFTKFGGASTAKNLRR